MKTLNRYQMWNACRKMAALHMIQADDNAVWYDALGFKRLEEASREHEDARVRYLKLGRAVRTRKGSLLNLDYCG